MESRSRTLRPTTVLSAVSMFALVTVEFGGWSLLRMLTSTDELSPFEEQFFRAGHGHAGVLLVLALVVFVLLSRTAFSQATQWLIGVGLLVGVLLQSGGFFLHMLAGEPERGSAGTVVTVIGGVLIGAALVSVGVGLLRSARGRG